MPRLGIPPLVITNGPAGVAAGDSPNQLPATALPAPISLAASFDTSLARGYGALVGREARALGANLVEAPDVDIARVPTAGRTFEAYGEDPFLTSAIAAPLISGLQGNSVIAQVKHFLGNNQETNRFGVDARIDSRTLHELYLPPYDAAVRRAHVGAVMCAFNSVNGTFACDSRRLLTDVLRRELGFDGFVGTDFFALHTSAPAARAGLDLEMPRGMYFGEPLRNAVPVSVIDRMLVRRYATMIRLGLFSPPAAPPLDAAAGRAFARDAAARGMVLLRNRGILPLDASKLRTVAIVQPASHIGGGGSSHVVPLSTSPPAEAFAARGVRVLQASALPQVASVAAQADVAVVIVGDSETEGADRPSLALPDRQDALVAAVAAANPRTIVVLETGGAVLMPWAARVPAILEAWYPGEEEGRALADVLFGDVNPSGKLPLTFPRSDVETPLQSSAQYPGVRGVARYSERLEVGYRWYDAQRVRPLFPFGFGLSYTSFAFRDLRLARHGKTWRARVAVTNTGPRDGTDVVQLYVAYPARAGEPPRQLRAFRKVFVPAGESRSVTLTLERRAFATWARGGWRVAPGRYRVFVGDSSRRLPLTASVAVG